MIRLLALAFSAAVLAGCGERTLYLESDTRWLGTMEGTGARTFEGSGDASFFVRPGKVCWRFQKRTEDGFLRLYARHPSLLGSESVGDSSTAAPYGVVSGCIQ